MCVWTVVRVKMMQRVGQAFASLYPPSGCLYVSLAEPSSDGEMVGE